MSNRIKRHTVCVFIHRDRVALELLSIGLTRHELRLPSSGCQPGLAYVRQQGVRSLLPHACSVRRGGGQPERYRARRHAAPQPVVPCPPRRGHRAARAERDGQVHDLPRHTWRAARYRRQRAHRRGRRGGLPRGATRDAAERGRTVLVASHDMRVAEVSDKVVDL